MKVSVITVCYNAEQTIEKTISSVLSQTYNDIEYIIVDGLSKDGTMEIVKRNRLSIAEVISEPDIGIYDAMNKGIRLAHGDLLFFLNADDVFVDDSVIAHVIDAFMPDDDIIFGDILVCDENNDKYLHISRSGFTKFNFIDSTINQPATFYTQMAFKRCGLFNTQYRVGGDFEWYLRAVNKKLHFHHIKLNIAVFKLGGISTNQKTLQLSKKERNAIVNEYYTNIEQYLYHIFYKRISWRMLKYTPSLWSAWCRLARWYLP